MSALQELIRSREQLRPLVESIGERIAIEPISRLGEQIAAVESVNRYMSQAVLNRSMLEEFFRRGVAFAEMAIRLKWPPPSHLPASLIDEITEAHSRGELSDTDVGDLFTSLYDAEVLSSVLQSWHGYEWLTNRFPILDEGIRNHVEGRYYSSVCTLLPQIEGAFEVVFERKLSPKNDAEKIFGRSRLPAVAKRFYVDVILDGGRGRLHLPVPELSRHKILHGSATAYGTAEHSLKVILILDAVLQALDEFRAA